MLKMMRNATIIYRTTINFDIWCPFGSQFRSSTPEMRLDSLIYPTDGQKILSNINKNLTA